VEKGNHLTKGQMKWRPAAATYLQQSKIKAKVVLQNNVNLAIRIGIRNVVAEFSTPSSE
jgi:hypothetical protein